MSETSTGGPAFPFVMPSDSGHIFAQGMTLRDYFAAKAMQSLVSDPDWRTGEWKTDIALAAYQMADAMLTARGETK